jgi:hypothetical protein
LCGNRTRTGTATAVRSGNLQADANRRAEFPVPSLWAKLLEEIRLGHSSAERRPGIDPGTPHGGRLTGPALFGAWEILGYGFQDMVFRTWDLNFGAWEILGHGFQDLGSQL